MRLLERLRRGHTLSGALLLCLTLVGVGAEARSASASSQEARPVMAPAMVSMADAKPMLGLADCAPCAGCYIAPAPATHGFSGEGKEPEEPVWRVPAAPLADADDRIDSGGSRPRVPVRIAFCRWLD